MSHVSLSAAYRMQGMLGLMVVVILWALCLGEQRELKGSSGGIHSVVSMSGRPSLAPWPSGKEQVQKNLPPRPPRPTASFAKTPAGAWHQRQ